jgi:hypothetical protein
MITFPARRHRKILLALGCSLALLGCGLSEAIDRSRRAHARCHLLVLTNALCEYNSQHSSYPENGVSLRSALGYPDQECDTGSGAAMSSDSSEHRLFYWSDERQFLLWAAGSDGRTDDSWPSGRQNSLAADNVFYTCEEIQWQDGNAPFRGSTRGPDIDTHYREAEHAMRSNPPANNAMNLSVRPVTRLGLPAPPLNTSQASERDARLSRPSGYRGR